MRRSKYPTLGILDALSRALWGFSFDPSKNGLYESLPPEDKPSREHFSKIIHQLHRNGYIRHNADTLHLTAKGKTKAGLRRIDQISLSKKEDGEHRLIAFDIPEKMKYARNIIRSKLKAFQCTKVQKSLYMTPYICEHEIEEISRILKITQHVTVLKLSKDNFARLNDRSKQRK